MCENEYMSVKHKKRKNKSHKRHAEDLVELPQHGEKIKIEKLENYIICDTFADIIPDAEQNCLKEDLSPKPIKKKKIKLEANHNTSHSELNDGYEKENAQNLNSGDSAVTKKRKKPKKSCVEELLELPPCINEQKCEIYSNISNDIQEITKNRYEKEDALNLNSVDLAVRVKRKKHKKSCAEEPLELPPCINEQKSEIYRNTSNDIQEITKKKKKKANESDGRSIVENKNNSIADKTISEKVPHSLNNKQKNDEEFTNAKYNDYRSKSNPNYHYSEHVAFKKMKKASWYPDINTEIHIPNSGRHYTISIAVPASILEETVLLDELRTYVIGQLARSASIYAVDEIIVYNDQCWRSCSSDYSETAQEYMGMMNMILELQECPQYLRKDLIPIHYYTRKAGVLNAVSSQHHLLANEWCTYREGVVLKKHNPRSSLVDVGLKDPVEVDRLLEPGLRVTVRFPPEAKCMKKRIGLVVSPEEPRTCSGLYWGYTVRTADTLSEVFKSNRFPDGYDLVIGTSDKGQPWYEASFKTYSHALIVFGGIEGIEAAVEADESIQEHPRSLFTHYLNVCPWQGSRIIRTEEAVLITLATLSLTLKSKGRTKPL